jgi:hypothetical protein
MPHLSAAKKREPWPLFGRGSLILSTQSRPSGRGHQAGLVLASARIAERPSHSGHARSARLAPAPVPPAPGTNLVLIRLGHWPAVFIKPVRVLHAPDEAGEALGHRPLASIAEGPQPSPDLYPDPPHTVRVFPRQQDAIPMHGAA